MREYLLNKYLVFITQIMKYVLGATDKSCFDQIPGTTLHL